MSQWQLNVYKIFALAGIMIIIIGFIIGLVIANTSNDYLGENTKKARDEATKNSGLQDQFVQIQSTSRWLEPFIFLGVASFMIGIALEFSTIPELLHNRAKNLSAAFPKIVEGGN